jgi:hypothetical protein
VLLGFVLIGIGASVYYGSLDLGSLTKATGTQQPGRGGSIALVPVGLGVLLMVVGVALGVVDRRARPSKI